MTIKFNNQQKKKTLIFCTLKDFEKLKNQICSKLKNWGKKNGKKLTIDEWKLLPQKNTEHRHTFSPIWPPIMINFIERDHHL